MKAQEKNVINNASFVKMKSKEQLAKEYRKITPNQMYGDELGFIAGFSLAEELFKPKWNYVSEQTPPINIDLLVKSPTGAVYLTSWRPSYNIFTCQAKTESSYDWKWIKIPQ